MFRSHAHRIGALILGAFLALPFAVSAQQAQPAAAEKAAPVAAPSTNNPPAWGDVSSKPQYASVPGRETNVLIQAQGHEWRKLRNGPVTTYGGWLLVAVLAVLALFYLVKGPMKLHGQPTGRLIERFNAVERVAHWTMGISFVVLAITGIVILFGKHIILPWLGHSGFAWILTVGKNLHNFVGPLFIFALVVFILLYLKDNFLKPVDFSWLAGFGGMLSGKELPSGRFNGGEKMWFWVGVVILGITVSVTGLILDFPNWNQGREIMQESNLIHAIAAILFMAASLGHIYMGTIGMQGAYAAMRDGFVDETWAKEHHPLWYDDIKAGKRPEKIVSGAAQPATGD